MKKQLVFLFVLLSAVQLYAQNLVTGVVISTDDELPVIGASVLVEGTTTGTITDFDGNFSLEVAPDAYLVVSYVGMKDKKVSVGGKDRLTVYLSPNVEELEEVVVTAMGLKAEKKKLNYAVQTLNSDELNAGQPQNFVSALQGKVAGVNITSAGGSPNAGTSMQIRAASSINPGQDNGPLFVIDGMAVAGSATNMSSINPSDIESMTVLKGVAASALYGSAAANGVVMITTKSGKSGQMQVNADVTYQVDQVTRLPKLQTMYAPGAQGFTKPLAGGGWGPLVQPGQPIYDNVGEFLQNGLYQKYGVSVSGGSEKFSAYASVNYQDTEGVVPEDYQERLGTLLKATFQPHKSLSINAQMNFTKTKSRGFGNSMGTIYYWPITNNMSIYEDVSGMVWREDMSELTDQEKISIPVNPYWSRYRDGGEANSIRNMLIGSINWNAFKGFNVSGKVSYDGTFNDNEAFITPRFKREDFASSDFADGLTSVYGEHIYTTGRSSFWTAQALATYNVDLNENFELGLLAGTELQESNGISSRLGGFEYLVPGDFYSIQNLNGDSFSSDYIGLTHSKKRKAGFFGEAKIDYKGIAHVSVTGRQDYSSTLSEPSYFYPSVTGGLIFSEMFKLSNDWFTYGKVRGNWARVGKDASPYLFDRTFKPNPNFPDQGFGVNPGKSVATYLKPEMIDSWELGLDLRFFDSKTTLDIAYYSTIVDNQIVTVRVSPSSGTILSTRNEGTVKNHGIEMQLNQQIMQNDNFSWNATLNVSLNRGKVLELPDGIVEIQGGQYGDAFATAYLNGSTTAISGKDYLRTEDGKIICTEDGVPRINPAKSVLIGDREPKCLLGLSSDFTYKNFSASFLFDGRVGGDVLNVTRRNLVTNGMHKDLETYRNRWILVDGVVEQADGSYVPNTKPMLMTQTNINTSIAGVTSNFVEDGSYLRLSYVTVGYDFTRMLKTNAVKGLRLNLTARNVFLLTKYNGSDPQINANTSAKGTGAAGIDNFGVPPTRSFNVSLNATF